jgi:hypothetical protein
VGLGGFVDAAGLAHRVGGDADRLSRTAGHRGHLLPQFFGDEGDDGVRQPQDGFQRADQRAAGGALLGLVAGLDLHLGDFQVPVAELVPDEVVNGVGHVVEPVLGKASGHFGFDRCRRETIQRSAWLKLR